MAEIGRYNILRIAGKNSDGLSLSDGKSEIVLPSVEVSPQMKINDTITAFVFLDKAGQLVATTRKAYAEVGDFALLSVIDAGEDGAFLDLGISKDVYVPVKEQRTPMRRGQKHIVYLYLDRKNQRMLASSRLHKYIDAEGSDFEAGDEVRLLIWEETDLGYNAIINNRYVGLLYHNELFADVTVGDKRKGWIKNIRVDGSIDLSLRPQGFGHVLDSKEMILRALKEEGTINLGDKSAPEEIHARFQISKNAFKKAIGGLYKERLIALGDHQIKLLADQ